MLRIFLILVVIYKCLSFPVWADSVIVSGKWLSLESVILGEKRPYAVYLPPSYTMDGNEVFPVLYVLDGDETRFRGISGLVESLSTENLEKQIPEFIIVAVPNTDRVGDLTPTNSNIVFKDRTTDEWSTSGESGKFLGFFEQELIPHIETNYRVSEQRALVGSSYGGLFAWTALLKRPGVFTHYLITDSNYIWDNNVINRIADATLAKGQTMWGKVFVSFANNAAFGEMGQANFKWGKELEEKLRAGGEGKLSIRSRYFENETHGTAEMLTWYYGLLDLFSEDGNKTQ